MDSLIQSVLLRNNTKVDKDICDKTVVFGCLLEYILQNAAITDDFPLPCSPIMINGKVPPSEFNLNII